MTLRKKQCEICKNSEERVLDAHHIIPRTDPHSTNKLSNLATLCSNCHRRVHALDIVIEGRFMTTVGSTLFFHLRDEEPVIIPGVILHKNGTATIVLK